jgi:hypothetical protein
MFSKLFYLTLILENNIKKNLNFILTNYLTQIIASNLCQHLHTYTTYTNLYLCY